MPALALSVMPYLGMLTELVALDLSSTLLTNQTGHALKLLLKVTHLSIKSCMDLTPGILSLLPAASLLHLDLSCMRGVSWVVYSQHIALHTLFLRDTMLSIGDMDALGSMSTLTTLSLGCLGGFPGVTADHVTASLGRLHRVEKLDVRDLPLNNETLERMGQINRVLVELSLQNTLVDSDMIQCLLPWQTTLQHLSVHSGTLGHRGCTWDSGRTYESFLLLLGLKQIVLTFKIAPIGAVLPLSVRPKNLEHVRVRFPCVDNPLQLWTEHN
jgi:hypothetical protein